MNTPATSSISKTTSKSLRIALWAAQVVLFATFMMSAFMKLTTPIPQLSTMMPWTGELPETFVRFIGLVDLAGGLGILLPALTRIKSRLCVLAAVGIIVLQVLAIGFHSSRGEWMVLPLNFVLLPLAIFVLWGRSRKAPIGAR
ncbi:DoxX-like family protein [Collimonas sp. OK607]|uniref:DoxX family protein n=1 Tax=Collimonas sp. OK607 TaxID=1798194 RepID=UPI0008EC0D97|nr:DoxX family protein [Collimonas sp. OK607]SFB34571.1 DoxX-like family protein [Collimonas sp. OK607]